MSGAALKIQLRADVVVSPAFFVGVLHTFDGDTGDELLEQQMAWRALWALPVPDPTTAGKEGRGSISQMIGEANEVVEQFLGGVDLSICTGSIDELSLMRNFAHERIRLTMGKGNGQLINSHGSARCERSHGCL